MFFPTNLQRKFAYSTKTKLHVHSVQYCFSFHHNTTNSRLNNRYLQQYLTNLTEVLLYNSNSKQRIVNIFVYENDDKKLLPLRRGARIDPLHVNSGYTQFDHSSGRVAKFIVIFRTEEFLKVLTHELIHWFGVCELSFPVTTDINSIFPKDSHFKSLNEALTELNALSFYNAIQLHIDNQLTAYTLRDRMETEYKYSLQNIEKLRWHFNCKYEFEGWKEGTNAFAYYVVKTILMAIQYKFIYPTFENTSTKPRQNNLRMSCPRRGF